jgi:shikimate dehydrogenase
LSPVLHRAAYAAAGLPWIYEAIDCGVDDLADVLRRRADWAGFSCTMPLKRVLLGVADEVSELAERVGAGNTLVPRAGGGWRADNTDVGGLVATVAEMGTIAAPFSATVLGAGGTARAAVVALAELGLERCVVLARNPDGAGQLRATAEAAGVLVELGRLDAAAAALRADVVVSALPPGAADAVAGAAWRAGQVVLDVVYHPWPTHIAGAAAAGGARVASGAVLLLHQAIGQFELMTGQPAPAAAMRAALAAVAPGGSLSG